MQFEFSNINTQYSQADVIASITKENTSSSKSDVSTLQNSSNLNLDAAVLSISNQGSAKINAMLSKSIQLRACAANPSLTTSDRQQVNDELYDIRKEITEIRNENKGEAKKTETTDAKTDKVKDVEDVDNMVKTSIDNILKQANECLQAQPANREHILQLL